MTVLQKKLLKYWKLSSLVFIIILSCTADPQDQAEDEDLATISRTLLTWQNAYNDKNWTDLEKTYIDSQIRFYLRSEDRWDYDGDNYKDGYYDYYTLKDIHKEMFDIDSIKCDLQGDSYYKASFDSVLYEAPRTLFMSAYKNNEKKTSQGQIIFYLRQESDLTWRIAEIDDRTGINGDMSLGLLYKYYWKGSVSCVGGTRFNLASFLHGNLTIAE